MPLKLSLLGPSGSGKSTAAGLVDEWCREHGRSCRRIKLSAPLYSAQEFVYGLAGRGCPEGMQDQVLLEDVARHLRRINPCALVERFAEAFGGAGETDVVINDDLRDPEVDYPALRDMGFRFVAVRCSPGTRELRLRAAALVTSRADESERGLGRIPADFTLDNERHGVEHLRDQVRDLVTRLQVCA